MNKFIDSFPRLFILTQPLAIFIYLYSKEEWWAIPYFLINALCFSFYEMERRHQFERERQEKWD